MARPSHAIWFIAGIVSASGAHLGDVEAFWAAVVVAAIGIWSAHWEGRA